jgi:arylsulfatase
MTNAIQALIKTFANNAATWPMTLLLAGTLSASAALAADPVTTARSPVLPVPEVTQPAPSTVLRQEAEMLKLGLKQAPQGAPNVVIVMLDDVGFGAASTFGGPVPTPALEALAKGGLRYNRFHTTAICSPTRAALLTGRNPHAVGIGAVLNMPSPYPGYSGLLPRSAATVAEILRQNGYATGAFGKWHLAPEWETTPTGPYDHWPLQQGFDHFYGFLPAETDQYAPGLVNDNTFIPTPHRAGYHLTEDLADQAIGWMRRQKSVAPDKPFFVYFTPGGTHAPLHAPKEYRERFRGQFNQGWDRLREETYARQKQSGIIPERTALTPRSTDIPAWDSLPPEQRAVASRLMETYAGFLAHTDAQVGRLAEALQTMGAFENTLFIYIVGDNGASSEGGLQGSLNYMAQLQGSDDTPADMQRRIDEIGTPSTHAHYPAGWAWATNSPFQWTKMVASHLGGIRNPLVVSWPARIQEAGALRNEWAFVADLMPTVLDAAGITPPAIVNGVAQQPITGKSLLPNVLEGKASVAHRTQYFQVFGNRSIYHDGWMASAFRGRAPWDIRKPIATAPLEDRWELYHLDEDFSQAHDLAASQPQKLQELRDLFNVEAGANQVYPLLDNNNPELLPRLTGGKANLTFYGDTGYLPETQAPLLGYLSHSLKAAIDLPAGSRGGVVAAMGGVGGGWALLVDERRRPVYVYNFFGRSTSRVLVNQALPVGRSTLNVAVDYAKPGSGGAAKVQLTVEGGRTANGTVPQTVPYLFSIHETFDVGFDSGSTVTDYRGLGQPPGGGEARFAGEVARLDVHLQFPQQR